MQLFNVVTIAATLAAGAGMPTLQDPPPLSDHYGLLVDFSYPKISISSAGGVTSSWS